MNAEHNQKVEELLTRGVEDVIVREELEKHLKSDKKMRIKFGIDPTGDKIHIGHAVVYWKLRAFQDLGHKVIILIGDYTALVGDASDKQAERQMLSVEDVKINMKSYLKQISKIVDMDKAEVRYNSEWLHRLSFVDILELASEFKVAQMLERDNFKLRYDGNQPIGLQEFLYPIMQGYDSVALKAHVELGGTEQLFNLMAGRVLQKRAGQNPQAIMTCGLLVGTNGFKMSKSQPNCIFVDDEPCDMYGKVMSLNDELIIHYLKLATTVEESVISQIEQNLAEGANPRDSKAFLARTIVARYYDEKSSELAETSWNDQFRDGNMPEEMQEIKLTTAKEVDLVELLSIEFELSKSEVRRLLDQKAIKCNGEVVEATEYNPVGQDVFQVGKRRYKRISISS